MNWRRLPFARPCFAWILGSSFVLIDGLYLPNSSIWIIILFLGVLPILFFRWSYRFRGIPGFALMLLIGALGYYLTDQAFSVPDLPNTEEAVKMRGELISFSHTESRTKAVIRVSEIQTLDQIEPFKVLLYFPDSLEGLEMSQNIRFLGVLGKPFDNQNPFSFDYGYYLKTQGIHFQVFLKDQSFEIDSSAQEQSFGRFIDQMRKRLSRTIRDSTYFDASSSQLLEALLLGNKRSIDPEIRDAFARTGALHVLAVSGLHVGLIFALLQMLSRFLFKWHKWYPWFRLFICLLGIWAFVFLSGSAPSVCRAGTMFSFFIIGDALSRKGNAMNSLAASAFCLMIVDPLFLFQVGFQLSYAAVWGILFFQPRLYRLWIPRSKILDWIWTLITVSFAAQIATLALVLFYFGRFSLIFWLSGLWVIPALTLILPVAILFILISGVPLLADPIAWLLNKLCFGMIKGVEYLSLIPFSEIEPIFLFREEMISLVLIILLLAWAWYQFNNKIWITGLTALLIWSVIHAGLIWDRKSSDWIVIYSVRSGHLLSSYSNELNQTWTYGIDSKAQHFAYEGFNRFLSFSQKDIRIQDSISDRLIGMQFSIKGQSCEHWFESEPSPIFKKSSSPPPENETYLWVLSARRQDLKKLHEEYPDRYWIIDEAWYTKQKKRIVQFMEEMKIPYYSIETSGPFVLKSCQITRKKSMINQQ